MPFNSELARKVLDDIYKDPFWFDQTSWRCGSGMCYAGHIVEEAGAEWVSDDPEHSNAHWLVVDPLDEYDDIHVIRHNGKYISAIHVEERAARLLGLGDFDSRAVFRATNALSDIERLIDEIEAEEAGEVL